MNPMGLMEMAQVKEQESMREALRRAAIREGRKQAGITWFQMVRARLFRRRGAVAAGPAAPTAARATAAAPRLRVVQAAELDCVGADC